METFSPARALVELPDFAARRRRALAGLADDDIDQPIQPLIGKLNRRPECFTLQCCYGHFVHADQPDAHHLAPLPPEAAPPQVTYRLAYLALCVDNTTEGRRLLQTLAQIPDLAPDHIQFGSPTWFWERQANSFALQVEPVRYRHLDHMALDYAEACEIERVRAMFFETLIERVA